MTHRLENEESAFDNPPISTNPDLPDLPGGLSIEPNSPFPLEHYENTSYTRVLRNRIILNPGISVINYYASLIHIIIVQFNHTVTSTLQPMILLDPASFDVDKANIGITLSKLMLLQTSAKITLTPLYGYLVDKIGRRPMIRIGGILTLIGYCLVPYQHTIFPGYAFCKILVANGGNIMSIVPFNADYVHDSTKGQATGITMALGSAGQFLGSLFMTVLLSMEVSLPRIHVIAGVTLFILTMINSFGIKGGNYHKEKLHEDDFVEVKHTEHEEEKFFPKLKHALKVIGENGWLLISLVISTLARADYYLVTIVFALFVKSFDKGSEDLHESNKLVNRYQDLFFGLSFLGNVLYGFILDKADTMKIIFPTLGAAIIGYSLGVFADSKESILLLLLIIFAGAAMPGLLNSANYLAIKNYPRDLRGMLASILSVIGIVGYLFLSTIGGFLFDHIGRTAPFFLFVLMLLGSMGAVVHIVKKKDLLNKTKELELAEDPAVEEMSIIAGI